MSGPDFAFFPYSSYSCPRHPRTRRERGSLSLQISSFSGFLCMGFLGMFSYVLNSLKPNVILEQNTWVVDEWEKWTSYPSQYKEIWKQWRVTCNLTSFLVIQSLCISLHTITVLVFHSGNSTPTFSPPNRFHFVFSFLVSLEGSL